MGCGATELGRLGTKSCPESPSWCGEVVVKSKIILIRWGAEFGRKREGGDTDGVRSLDKSIIYTY